MLKGKKKRTAIKTWTLIVTRVFTCTILDVGVIPGIFRKVNNIKENV